LLSLNLEMDNVILVCDLFFGVALQYTLRHCSKGRAASLNTIVEGIRSLVSVDIKIHIIPFRPH